MFYNVIKQLVNYKFHAFKIMLSFTYTSWGTQSRISESQGCMRSETAEEQYNQKESEILAKSFNGQICWGESKP